MLEGEPATDSDTFQAFQLALGANDRVYFADSTARLRTIDPDGRLRTLAGNGRRGTLVVGPALATPMPTITQIAVSPAGVVHFSSAGRVYRLDEGRIVAVAGSGRPGFNGEAALPLELNLGTVVNFAFDSAGVLYLVDSFLRVRRLGSDGQLRTFAGSTNFYDFQGTNGAGGPATAAAFQVPRQVVPLREGTVWIRDLRRVHAVGADGIIRTINENFDPSFEILLPPEGNPVAAAQNRVTLFGSGLGPPAGQGITLDGYARAAGQPAPYPNPLLGLRMMSGTLAGFTLPVIFANDTQMTVQVPFLGAGDLVLFWSWNGLTLSYPKPIALRSATPGIFVQGSGRDGAAAALNQDGSLNSPQRPAAKNSIALFYLTGLGGVHPPLAGPGAFNSATSLQRTLERVTARIAGLDATVEFAGAAPGFVGGLYQVNVRIPPNAPTGAQSVDFEVAGATTSAFQKVTVQVE